MTTTPNHTTREEISGPERIFLKPDCCVDWAGHGREWSSHDMWGDDCPDHKPAVEYIRADLAALQSPTDKERDRLALKALRDFIYETTHLSPMNDDGSHDCRISAECLADGRIAYTHLSRSIVGEQSKE